MLKARSKLGKFELLSELGSGAMGTVYLAADAAGERFALKVLLPHLLAQPGSLERFVREAEVGKTVDHKNVVRTLDLDSVVVDGETYHFLIMQYVEGRHLRQLLGELGAMPESLLREIALQCAAGLAAIHAQGIVHRDLKPENILVTKDHEVRIMDLGLAKLQEATLAITLAGHFAGSMLYAAPEQFVSEPLGPASDLYALGVTLYELARGENPFRRQSAAGVIDAHLYYEPPRLADPPAETTPFFSELVAKLLAKRPDDRFASAAELHAVLTDGERSAWWSACEPEVRKRAGSRPRIPVVRESGLHGRRDALATLKGAWCAAREGNGNTVLIEGEAGIGKTRLIDAFLETIEDDDAHVLYGAYPPTGGLGALSDAILEKFGKSRLAEALQNHLRVTPTLVPAFAALLKHEDPPPGSPVLSTAGLRTVCTHLMRALAAERPLLWVVDDLHAAPKESRDVALALARAVPGRHVLLLLSARPGLPADERARFERMPGFASLVLDRLTERDVVALLGDVLGGEQLTDALGKTIAHKTDGVPLFVLEMVRAFETRRSAEQVPSAIRDLIGERLAMLSEEQRRMLDVAAVQGFQFEPRLVADVLGMEKVRALGEFATVETRTGLVRGAAGGAKFDLQQVREVVYQQLTAEQRAAYHTLLADMYAKRLQGAPTGPQAAILASHHLRGRRPDKAACHLGPAFEHLESAHRNEALIEMAEWVSEHKGLLEPAERIDVLLRQARCLGRLGRRARERAVLRDAVTVADDTERRVLRARARLALGQHLLQTSRYEAAAEVAGRALDLACAAGEQRLEARAEEQLGRVFLHLSRYGEALTHFERQLHLAHELGDKRGETAALGNLGVACKSTGRYAPAQAHFERALKLARALGDLALEAAATGGLGTTAKGVGKFEEARLHFERQRELARATGDRFMEATATGNLGLVFKNLGRFEEARACFEHGLEISREIDYRLGESIGLGHLGLVLKQLARFDEARVQLVRARDLAREIGDRQGEAMVTGNLGGVAFDEGEFEEAQRHYEEWRETARELGDRQGEAIATGNLGNTCVAQGRYADAKTHFETTRDIARELGDRTGEAVALTDLGSLLGKLGDADCGRELLQTALKILRELGERRSESYALQGLGDIEEDEAKARAYYEEALKIRNEIAYPLGEAETELALGHFDRALAFDFAVVRVPALCRLAATDPERAEEAERAYEEHAEHLPVEARMDAGFQLWRATGKKCHLLEAHRLLDHLREHAPPESRDKLGAVHAAIERSWEQVGEPAAG